jgi:hypothetical protein
MLVTVGATDSNRQYVHWDSTTDSSNECNFNAFRLVVLNMGKVTTLWSTRYIGSLRSVVYPTCATWACITGDPHVDGVEGETAVSRQGAANE